MTTITLPTVKNLKVFGLTKSEFLAAARFFAQKSSSRIKVPFQEIVIILQNDSESAAVHFAIMNVAGPTDVITQPFYSMPGEPEGIYGEIYINLDRALTYSNPKKELFLYLAHGMDHLSGADDHTEREYQAMRRRELRWIREFLK